MRDNRLDMREAGVEETKKMTRTGGSCQCNTDPVWDDWSVCEISGMFVFRTGFVKTRYLKESLG